jgi:GntR family carbon starvation induced transcriptional regulator
MNVIDGKDGSATRMAYITLRDMILTGELPAGKKLKIEDLRTLLATGASPVREALSLLTSDMLVERIDQRGFRAAPASIANFDEILSLRCALDDKALRQSIAAATSAWEERLVLAHHRMNRTAAQDPASFEDAHKRFHMTLLDNSGSPMLERFCSQLYDLNIRYRNLAADGPDYKKRDIPAEHQAILDAVIRRKSDEASLALLNHYRRTGEYLMGQLTNL